MKIQKTFGVLLALAWLALSAAQAQTTNYSLGTSSLLEGPGAGMDSVVLGVTPATAAWTNTANADWLHLSLANQIGDGSTNVIFSFDANPGATRTGTLNIAGQTLTVTQAGSTYVPANALFSFFSTNLYYPYDVAVDAAGNAYFASEYVYKWTKTNNSVKRLVYQGLNDAIGLALDGAGNIYIEDAGYQCIFKWTASNSNLTALVSSGLDLAQFGGIVGGVAVDPSGNVYFADFYHSAIKEWSVANSNVTTLASGLNGPTGVALDAAGNVYFAELGNRTIKEWMAAGSNVTVLVASGLNEPQGLAVDQGGNVYVADSVFGGPSPSSMIRMWTAATGNVTTIVPSGLAYALGVAVDSSDNIYIADASGNSILEVPHAFVDPTTRVEGLAAGSDSLPVVLPSTENLLAPCAPVTSYPWLTIKGVTNDVVSFSFSNTTSARMGDIILLGVPIAVGQGAATFTYTLGASALAEGPGAGSDGVVLSVNPYLYSWTNTANASWLHLSLANQSGAGSANIIFSFDANPGTTRTGTITIGGQTLTVTQAGSTYVAAGAVVTLLSTNHYGAGPSGVAGDSAGNVYGEDYFTVYKWTAASDTVSLLANVVSAAGVAVDTEDNVYISEDNTLLEWKAANSNVTTLVSSGLISSQGVAVDGAGNVYIADNGWIKEWTAVNSNMTTLVSSGLSDPHAVALDGAGNVYIADSYNNAIKEWSSAKGTVTALVSSGLSEPVGVAVDGAGNVYFADYGHNAIKEWTAANSNITTLVSSGLSHPWGVAVDSAGNLYFADNGHNAIKELPRAFVDPTPISEGLAAGSDVLPVVLPATENLLPPFVPTSDQSWLTISGVANGVVSFSFSGNTGLSRTGHITLLGQSIAITQAGVTPPNIGGIQIMPDYTCQFTFTNTVGASFTVLCSSDLSVPLSNWTVVGTASNTAPGQFQFATPPVTNGTQSFYTVRSP